MLNRLLILLALYLSISQGATGKCTSLFKFFEGVVSKCLGSSPAISNGVQPEVAHLPTENSIQNAEARKRSLDDHSSGAP